MVGYYSKPVATALECVRAVYDTFSVPAGYNSFRTSSGTGVCSAGYSAISAICESNVNGIEFGGSGISANSGYCYWRNTAPVAINVYQGTYCCRIPGR